MNVNKYLDYVKTTESNYAYFWAIETAFQLNAINSDEYDLRIKEWREIEDLQTKKLLENLK